MKVYIVVRVSYSFRERDVVSVHATRQEANAEVRKHPDDSPDDSHCYEVEMHKVKGG